jgi:hypothetical protein
MKRHSPLNQHANTHAYLRVSVAALSTTKEARDAVHFHRFPAAFFELRLKAGFDYFEGEIGRDTPIRRKNGRQHLSDLVELPATLLRLPWGFGRGPQVSYAAPQLCCCRLEISNLLSGLWHVRDFRHRLIRNILEKCSPARSGTLSVIGGHRSFRRFQALQLRRRAA